MLQSAFLFHHSKPPSRTRRGMPILNCLYDILGTGKGNERLSHDLQLIYLVDILLEAFYEVGIEGKGDLSLG